MDARDIENNMLSSSLSVIVMMQLMFNLSNVVTQIAACNYCNYYYLFNFVFETSGAELALKLAQVLTLQLQVNFKQT